MDEEKKLIKLDGVVEAPVGHDVDDFLTKFIRFIEAEGCSFAGSIEDNYIVQE